MSQPAVRLALLCALCLTTACASTADTTTDDDASSTTGQTEPDRPSYHADSDAERLGYDEAKRVARVVCGAEPAARECRRSLSRSALGYRGSFSAPDAEEMVVVSGDTAVLIRSARGQWSRVADLEGIDADACLIANHTTDKLICRVPVARESGYATEFFEIEGGEDDPLIKKSLGLPKATDVDSVLFAGWKDTERGVQVRIHDADQVRSEKTTINMGENGACKHRTFVVEPGGEQAVRELGDCTTKETLDQGSNERSTYEGELSNPIAGRNRYYAMCYQNEIERLQAEAKRRDELTEQCEAGTAADEVDCEQLLADEGGDQDAAADSEEAASDDQDDLQDAEKLAGQITTRIVIGSAGAPVACEVVDSTMKNERVESCLCREMMETAFPPVPKGGFFDVTYPFDFSPEYTR